MSVHVEDENNIIDDIYRNTEENIFSERIILKSVVLAPKN